MRSSSARQQEPPSTVADHLAAIGLRDVEWSDPRETLRKGARLTSQRYGIIRHMGSGAFFAGDPRCFSVGIVACDTTTFSESKSTSKSGGGSTSLDQALAATIGEAVERYSMLLYDKSTMVKGSYRELADQAVHPDLLRLYSREQIAAAPKKHYEYFAEDSPICWVRAYSLTHGCWRLVPSTLVYLDYRYDKDETRIGTNASSGLAAGNTMEEAILTGLYEVVERDAFTASWLQRQIPRRVRVDHPELDALLTQEYKQHHPEVEIDLFEVTLDIPLTSIFMCMRRPTEVGPVVCVGTACRLDPAAAVRKTIFEVGQAIPYFRFIMPSLDDWTPKDDFSDVISFDEHSVFYIKRPDLLPDAFSFCDPTEEIALSAMQDQSTGRALGDLERCVEVLAEHGHEVLVADITTPDVADAGFSVVRVIVPGLLPLHGDHNWPFLGTQRLHDLPAKMGWPNAGSNDTNNGADSSMRRGRAAFNHFPHPFP